MRSTLPHERGQVTSEDGGVEATSAHRESDRARSGRIPSYSVSSQGRLRGARGQPPPPMSGSISVSRR